MTVRVKLNDAGFRALLTSPEVQAEVDRRAEAIAKEAGEGYEVLPNDDRRARAGSSVVASTYEARIAEARDHRLLGAMDAGR